MRKVLFSSMVIVFILAIGTIVFAQPMGPGMMGPGYGYQQPEDWNYCPYCGSYMGPRGGYGMGPGMMGRGYGMGPGMMYGGRGMEPQYGPGYGHGYGPGYQGPQKPMDKEEAKELLENYLQSTRNPNLRLGKIEDKGDSFEAEIQTKTGSLVDKIIVDKRTGWMRSAY